MPTSGTTGASNLVLSPLAFVRSGDVNLGYGNVSYVGYNGFGWSHTSRSSTSTYALYFTPTGVYPSDSNNHYVGRPLRCL